MAEILQNTSPRPERASRSGSLLRFAQKSNPTERAELHTQRQLGRLRASEARDRIAYERENSKPFTASRKKEWAHAKIEKIRSYSYWLYHLIILIEVAKWGFSIIEFVPVIGYALMMVVSLCIAIASAIILTIAHIGDPVKNHSRFIQRMMLTFMTGGMSAILPYIDVIIPFTLINAIVIWRMVRIGHKKEIARLQGIAPQRFGYAKTLGILGRTVRRAVAR